MACLSDEYQIPVTVILIPTHEQITKGAAFGFQDTLTPMFGTLRTRTNLMATMLLGGLWHGASWAFMLWGGLHSMFLIVHRIWRACPLGTWLSSLPGLAGFFWRVFCIVLTFHCVCLAWCFFRLTAFPEALTCVEKCYQFDSDKACVGAQPTDLCGRCFRVCPLGGVAALGEGQTRTDCSGGWRGPHLVPVSRAVGCVRDVVALSGVALAGGDRVAGYLLPILNPG